MKKIALLGNPNTGKTSIFNRLTGLNHHVGNFPGITVEYKKAKANFSDEIEIIDLPGTYSLFPNSLDERVVYEVLSNKEHEAHPDTVVVVVDASNLTRNLLLFSQVYDLNIPCVLVINQSDIARKNGITINTSELSNRFSCPVIETNARIGFGIDELKSTIKNPITYTFRPFISNYKIDVTISNEQQQNETKERYALIQTIVDKAIHIEEKKTTLSDKIDRLLVHPLLGYFIFLALMFGVFQVIFSVASIPMDLIDGAIADFSVWTSETMPSGMLNDLICGGIIPGIGAVLVFLPQILLLFFCIGILEETGYLARVVFMMDKLLRPFGLHGKSIVPLISSTACAIPGIMATRTISSSKERLITILVAPLMSCSARLPVFTLIISLVVPNTYVFGFINIQALAMLSMYLLGIISALLIALMLKWILKTKDKSYFILELPSYRMPRWNNILISLFEKGKVFIFEAGKVILAISIVLWFLASYGPEEKRKLALDKITTSNISKEQLEEKKSAVLLETSYIGILGKTIEPVIKPLGYDWKIGIALITSFAAREVFVGSMATIYSVHQEDEQGLISRLKSEKNIEGKPIYSLATGLSLMVFYVFAMQCMATLAVVKRETNSWKWPLIQLAYLGVLAYISSFIVYQILA